MFNDSSCDENGYSVRVSDILLVTMLQFSQSMILLKKIEEIKKEGTKLLLFFVVMKCK